MAISKSSKKIKKQKGIARAFIFSGRPDPTWPVTNTLLKQLEKIWNSLEVVEDFPSTPLLGYRGCLVRDNINHEWFVYGKFVKMRKNRVREIRLDGDFAFEKLLLSSAPVGTLPLSSSFFEQKNPTESDTKLAHENNHEKEFSYNKKT